MQLVHAQQLLAQRHITVHFVQVPVHGFNQVGVDLGFHLVGIQRSLQCAVIVPCRGKELQLLKLCVQRCGNGVFHLAEACVIGLKGISAKRAVGAFQQRHKRARCERVHLTLPVAHLGEAQICISQHAADVFRASCHLACCCQQAFFRCREHMCLQPSHGCNRPAVCFQGLLFGEKPFHRFL